jgi:hypothetical protein
MKAKFVYESIKHLTPRSDEEIESELSQYPFYPKFIFAIELGLISQIKNMIKSEEFKNLTLKEMKEATVIACRYDNTEIVRLLFDNGGDARWVNLGWVDHSNLSIIKEYRKKYSR